MPRYPEGRSREGLPPQLVLNPWGVLRFAQNDKCAFRGFN
jgi:hypothetical protein